MNLIESTLALSSPQMAEVDSLLPAAGISDPVALKALRSLMTAPQNPAGGETEALPAPPAGSLPDEENALQPLADEAETLTGSHQQAAHFNPSQISPFAAPDTSVPADSLAADLEVIIAPKPTASPSSKKDDAESSPDSSFPDPGLIETLRELLGHPGQSSPAAQSTGIPAEGENSGSKHALEIVRSLLSEETLPAASQSLLMQVRDVLVQTKGDLNLSPEARAQLRSLIENTPLTAGPVQEQQPIQTNRSPAGLVQTRPSIQTNEPPLAVLLEDSSDSPPYLETPDQEPPSLGQLILQSLDTQSSASVTTAAAVNQPAHLERVEQFSALIAEMADRVLVTDPLHGQTQEVRIQLAESVMPGTEVRVWREEGGQLRVDFDTASGYWARVLNEASPLLAQRLNERLNLPEAVLINVQQQGGQPQDGRSRNRHTPWDMAGQEAPQ